MTYEIIHIDQNHCLTKHLFLTFRPKSPNKVSYYYINRQTKGCKDIYFYKGLRRDDKPKQPLVKSNFNI